MSGGGRGDKIESMKYSQVFGKSKRGASRGAELLSHQLLVKAGMIQESTAGRYFYLPLGWRVHEKIKAVIKEEMDKAGAQEMISPVLHPYELWEETNRNNTTGFELMGVKDRSGRKFALGGTAEEMFVDVVRKLHLSYRDLPINLYQFSTKFRDELRARGGLLRVREFVMKDAYSFDRDEADFLKVYELMKQTYIRIFERLGLKTWVVEADNGYIGGEYCHELVVEHPQGESNFLVSEDEQYVAHLDVAKFKRQEVNLDEPMRPMQIVEQPEWVKTMEDNIKHYGLPKERFLKNVVYKNRVTGELVIAGIRGDLTVNKTKLEQLLKAVGQLVDAEATDLEKIGTKPGYVHSWGHNGVLYVGDISLKTVKNFIGGQKEEKTDSRDVNYGRDFECEILGDIAEAEDGMMTEDGKQKLSLKRGIEVGNIFQLGYHYSKLMKEATYVAEDGQNKPYYMGCYGIGLGRTLATIVEKYHDDKGIVWPRIVAPFGVHLISLEGVEQKAVMVYENLLAAGIEVLWDERRESPGVKFADADLLGIPVRLVVSAKTQDKVEWKERGKQAVELIDVGEVIKRLQDN